jgi:asparagine synthase (glutamine-hydrolysing)
MCGIVGFVDPEGRIGDPRAVLERMREELTHRGPDDAGSVHCAPLYAGHRRLAIVDTSTQGRQPFVELDAHGEPEIVAWANGEIYNHGALRERIRDIWPEHEVKASDCAVLPRLWRLEREGTPRFLEGMFAIAIWDARSQELLLARDPAGQKPLYYAVTPGNGLAFASEIKALLRHPGVEREVDPVGLRRYLAFETISGSASIYKGIRRLGPGERLLKNSKGLRIERYGEMTPVGTPYQTLEESAEALMAALGEATTARLMADVPVGIWLSGGLDSAALATLMPGAGTQAFSMGFSDPAFDEGSAAQAVATHLSLSQRVFETHSVNLLEHIDSVVSRMDEPFADPSILPTSLLARATADSVKVVLGGDGGDELLLGYPTFYAERWARLAARLPRAIRQSLLGSAARALPVSTGYMGLDFKVRRFLMGLEHEPTRRHGVWVGSVAPGLHDQALAPHWRAQTSEEEVFAHLDALARRAQNARPDAPWLERIASVYLETYLADGVLAKVDRASMAYGLEVRAPFLDPRVQRVAARIPLAHKLKGTQTKRVLRHALRGRLPQDVLARPKRGFGVPLASWLRGPLADWMDELLSEEQVRAQGLLDPQWVRRLVQEHKTGQVNHRKELWSALMLGAWCAGPYGPSAGG